MDQYGTMGFLEMLMDQISTRRGIGKDLSEGLARAAIKWGTYEEDLKSGELNLAYWGTALHYDPRSEAEWGFGSLMGERDLMLHAIANYPLHWMPQAFAMDGAEPYLSAEDAVKITAEAMIPYEAVSYTHLTLPTN